MPPASLPALAAMRPGPARTNKPTSRRCMVNRLFRLMVTSSSIMKVALENENVPFREGMHRRCRQQKYDPMLYVLYRQPILMNDGFRRGAWQLHGESHQVVR